MAGCRLCIARVWPKLGLHPVLRPHLGAQNRLMAKPPLNPPVALAAPTDETLTEYDQQHLVTYLRLLDAEAEGAGWTEVALLVLRIDPVSNPAEARAAWESHLARAKWLADHGYRHLLRRDGAT